jgi:hypothetical protein
MSSSIFLGRFGGCDSLSDLYVVIKRCKISEAIEDIAL